MSFLKMGKMLLGSPCNQAHSQPPCQKGLASWPFTRGVIFVHTGEITYFSDDRTEAVEESTGKASFVCPRIQNEIKIQKDEGVEIFLALS